VVAATGMALLRDSVLPLRGRLADGHQIRTSATTTTLAVNITPGHADFITTTGIQGPYDWALPNIVDDDGALRSAFLAKTDGSGVCPTGFNVPTEAQLKAETDIWDRANNAEVSAFNSVLKLPVAGANYIWKRPIIRTLYTSCGNKICMTWGDIYRKRCCGGGCSYLMSICKFTPVMPYPLLLPHLLNVKSPSNAIPTTATAHTFEFSQVTSSTGQVWMDRNLGASQVATSSTDPASYGDSYFSIISPIPNICFCL
jgi:hypothetical protein